MNQIKIRSRQPEDVAVRKHLGAQRAEVAYLIQHEMRKRGYTQKKLARELGCSANNISKVLRGIGHSELVLEGLRAIGLPEGLLFDPRRAELTSEIQEKM